VEWFGESTVSIVSKNCILTIEDGVNRRLKKTILTSQLRAAIFLALNEAYTRKETRLNKKES